MSSPTIFLWICLLAAGVSASAFSSLLIGLLESRHMPPGAKLLRSSEALHWRVAEPMLIVLRESIRPLLSVDMCARLLGWNRRCGLVLHDEAAELPARAVLCGALGALAGGLIASRTELSPAMGLLCGSVLALLSFADAMRRHARLRVERMLRELPFYLDLITMAVESGLHLGSALLQAVDKGPPGALRDEFTSVLDDLRAGLTRQQAWRALETRVPVAPVRGLVSSLILAEQQGSSIGPVLRAQAEQRRTERFALAEKRAMEAPVKMIPVLVVFVFPSTFVVLMFPIVSRFIEEGWL